MCMYKLGWQSLEIMHVHEVLQEIRSRCILKDVLESLFLDLLCIRDHSWISGLPLIY